VRFTNPSVEGWRGGGRGKVETGKKRNERKGGEAGDCIDAFNVVGWSPDARNAFGIVPKFVFKTTIKSISPCKEQGNCVSLTFLAI